MDFTPESVDRFLAADRAGKLSTKDRIAITKLRAGVRSTPEEDAADLEESLSEANLKDLANTIATTTHPKKRAILLEEQDRLMRLLGTSAMTETPPAKEETILDTIGNLLNKLWSFQ